jgi:hypothetical protein
MFCFSCNVLLSIFDGFQLRQSGIYIIAAVVIASDVFFDAFNKADNI